MHPQLARIVQELQAAQNRLHHLAKTVPEERWSARSTPGAWSVGECVAHLNITSQMFIPRLRAALADERFRGVPGPSRYHRDLSGWLIGLVAGPLPRFRGKRIGRVKTGASFVPTGDASRSATVAEFDRLQDDLTAIVRDADGRPIQRMRIKSPFDPRGRIGYNVYSAFVALPRHQQRHLDQADEVWLPRSSS